MRADHQAIEHLLRAFGIDTDGLQEVEITSGLCDATVVRTTRLVFDADPSHIQTEYAVTAEATS